MKRKWKWLILLCLPVVLLAVFILTVGSRRIPVDVVGELRQAEVDEIAAALKCEIRREILPHFSWRSIKGMPGAIKRYSSIKRFTIFTPAHDAANETAFVFSWTDTNGLWSVKDLSNGWFGWQGWRVWEYRLNRSQVFNHVAFLVATNGTQFFFEKRSNHWSIIRELEVD